MVRTLLRRLRGLVVTALLWAVTWAVAGMLAGIVLALRFPPRVLDAAFVGAISMGLYGAIGGTLFAAVLMVAERRRNLESLSLARVAAWGALGGMGLPLLVTVVIATSLLGHAYVPAAWVFALALFGGLGAACAAGTLALARRPTAVASP